MKRIGLIGVGNIAEKAYLPIFAGLQDKYEFIVSSRTRKKAEQIRAKYDFFGAVEGIDELIEAGVEIAFVHSATKSHFDICYRLMQAGVHVFVDKPVSEKLEEVAQLQKLSTDNKVLLMAGFNRRFAPKVQELKKVPEKNMIFVSKNRMNAKQRVDFVLYDLFIHPLDTAMYLLDDEEVKKYSAKLIREGDFLKRAFVRLETENTSVVVTMNMQSGANTEEINVQSLHGTYKVDNLVDLVKEENGVKTLEGFSDWTTTLQKRGFEPMVQTFLEAVEIREKEGDYIKAMLHCKQQKVHKSHEIIRNILKEYGY